jgi:hypothetical protein
MNGAERRAAKAGKRHSSKHTAVQSELRSAQATANTDRRDGKGRGSGGEGNGKLYHKHTGTAEQRGRQAGRRGARAQGRRVRYSTQ